jgi:hypothetical protein
MIPTQKAIKMTKKKLCNIMDQAENIVDPVGSYMYSVCYRPCSSVCTYASSNWSACFMELFSVQLIRSADRHNVDVAFGSFKCDIPWRKVGSLLLPRAHYYYYYYVTRLYFGASVVQYFYWSFLCQNPFLRISAIFWWFKNIANHEVRWWL